MSVTTYRIRLKGHLSERWLEQWKEWFGELTMSNAPNGEAALTVQLRDQAELHGLLMRVRDLNLMLLAVEYMPNQDAPPLERNG